MGFGKHKKRRGHKAVMEPRALLLTSQYPDIAELDTQLTALRVEARDKINELEVMAQQIAKAAEERRLTLWKEIEAKALGFLPGDYSTGAYNLRFHAGALIIESAESGDPCTCAGCMFQRALGIE